VTFPLFVQAEKPKAEGRPADELRAAVLKQATTEGKPVFLIFGSQGCGWCKVFDKYHGDPDVASVLSKHFGFAKVSIDENPGGDKMYLEYGKQRGVPAYSILAADGKVLADSGDEGKNIGFPYEPHEIAHYFATLTATCPALSESDAAMLRQKLNDVRPNQE